MLGCSYDKKVRDLNSCLMRAADKLHRSVQLAQQCVNLITNVYSTYTALLRAHVTQEHGLEIAHIVIIEQCNVETDTVRYK